MRDFHIYKNLDGTESKDFIRFANEIEERINTDEEIISIAKSNNKQLFERLKSVMKDNDNAEYIGRIVLGLEKDTPRYHYLKNVKYNGKEYDVEIDTIWREFSFIEIKQ